MTRIAVISVLLAYSMDGQQVFKNASISYGPESEIHIVFSNFRALDEVITDAPYAAETVFEQTHALSDGTITRQTRVLEHKWRDSLGRVRVERAMLPDQEKSVTLVQIFDPIAGCGYILDDQNKIAHRVIIGSSAGHDTGADDGSIGATDVRPKAALSSRERLGSKTIEGVVAEGTRQTMTWPPGSQDDDRPLNDVIETWYSPELRAMVLSKTISVRDGETTLRLANIRRAEASPALFQPPPDYTIADDRGTVTLNLRRQ